MLTFLSHVCVVYLMCESVDFLKIYDSLCGPSPCKMPSPWMHSRSSQSELGWFVARSWDSMSLSLFFFLLGVICHFWLLQMFFFFFLHELLNLDGSALTMTSLSCILLHPHFYSVGSCDYGFLRFQKFALFSASLCVHWTK